MNFPTSAECHDVPHARITTRSMLRRTSSGISISCRKTWPLSTDARPSTVSLTAHGCSKISLSMKCLYPAFSAMTGSHETRVLFFETARPE